MVGLLKLIIDLIYNVYFVYVKLKFYNCFIYLLWYYLLKKDVSKKKFLRYNIFYFKNYFI